jgi:tripartite ATP-independent transporter DctM subunit
LPLLLAGAARPARKKIIRNRSGKDGRLTMMVSPFALCIVTIVFLGALGLPIGHSMIVASIFYLLLSGLDLGTAAEQILNGLFNSYVLLAIPLFILAADLMNIGSLTDRLLQFCLVLVGRFRGGLGHVNVVANMIFAGMSGSAIADAVGIGRIIIGMMTKDGRYPVAYAAAITASAAIIGPIIPPSIPMVVYALVSDTSIGYLFLGGFVPGIMLGIAFMVMNSIIARRRNYPVEAPVPLRDVPRITLRAFPALLLPVILLFGIYGGVMTPTEGAAAAAFYALFASTVLYRAVTWKQLYAAILTSGKATTSIGMLIAGALIFNYVVTIENIPTSLANFMHGMSFSAGSFLLVVNTILLILGCLLEGTTILLVIVPIFIPTAKALGIDLVHFGVVVVVNIMIGLLTPPYGLLLFVLANMTKQPLGAIVREAAPFIFAAILVLAVITWVPESILWLPRLMGYKG